MNADQLLTYYDRIADAPEAIARLRRFILDLAVRGKLVPQDPNDKPASELLKRIAAEKARLVKAGEIRKERSFPKIEPDKIPYPLPPLWEWTRIREITSDHGQKVPDKDFTYIDVTAIDKEVGCIAETKIISATDAPSRARKVVYKGDVIYSCVRPYLLNIAIVEDDYQHEPIVSTAFAVLNGFGLVLPKYQWIVLRSPFMVACVEEKMRGQAYPAINDADFAVLPFPLPPLAEQQRIIERVNELMKLCDQLEAARANRETTRDHLAAASLTRLNHPDPQAFRDHAAFALKNLAALTTRPDQVKALRQTILNLAVRGMLVPQDPGDEPASELLRQIMVEKGQLVIDDEIKHEKEIFKALKLSIELPNGWKTTTLQTICISVTDGDHQPPPKVESGVPFLVIGNVRSKVLDFSDCRFVSADYYNALDPIRQPRAGDLLYTLVGSYGIPVIVSGSRQFCVQRHIGILRPSKHINVEFLAYALESDLVFAQATYYATGIAQKTVPLSGLRKIIFPLPPLVEQRRIVARVNELIRLCNRLEANLTMTDTSRRSLLDAILHAVLMPTEEFEET